MIEPFDQVLAQRVDAYIESLMVPRDETLEQGQRDAEAAGLPAINVSANEGKLLYLLAKMVRARRILEIGALGGYSGTWLGRALPSDGRLVSLELDPAHAAVARKNLARAGLGDRAEVRVGPAATLLRAMIEQGEAPFDLVFIDADKDAYPEYLELSLRLTHSGSLILADNLIRNGRVLEATPTDPRVKGVKAYNAAIAAHPRLESQILPIVRDSLDGLSISIVK
jgi:predicted O-methyltransferase YrrM